MNGLRAQVSKLWDINYNPGAPSEAFYYCSVGQGSLVSTQVLTKLHSWSGHEPHVTGLRGLFCVPSVS